LGQGRYIQRQQLEAGSFLKKLLEEGPGPLEQADIGRDLHTATAGKGYYLIYFGKEVNESWLFSLPYKNSKFDRPVKGTRYKVEIIDTWDMTIQSSPLIFEIGAVNDYRVYDKDLKKNKASLKTLYGFEGNRTH
jgi:hypothetical protein